MKPVWCAPLVSLGYFLPSATSILTVHQFMENLLIFYFQGTCQLYPNVVHEINISYLRHSGFMGPERGHPQFP